MSKKELDTLIQKNYEKWVIDIQNLYPQYCDKVADNVTECYQYLIRKTKYSDIEDSEGLFAYFVNWTWKRNYNFLEAKKELAVDISTLQLPEEEKEDIKEVRMMEVSNALQKLPLYYQILYHLRYVQGQSVSRLSRRYSLSKRTLYRHLAELKQQLKDNL